jgi:hypothetical protein
MTGSRQTPDDATTGRDLLALMPAISRAAPQWRRALIAILDRALADGYGPWALWCAADTIAYSTDAPGREIPALRAALRDLAGDVKGGSVCGWCGQDQNRPRTQTCERCNLDAPMTGDEVAALDGLRQDLADRRHSPVIETHIALRWSTSSGDAA